MKKLILISFIFAICSCKVQKTEYKKSYTSKYTKTTKCPVWTKK